MAASNATTCVNMVKHAEVPDTAKRAGRAWWKPSAKTTSGADAWRSTKNV